MTKTESQRRKTQNALSFSKLYQLGSTGHLYIIGKRKPTHQEQGELQRSFLLPPFSYMLYGLLLQCYTRKKRIYR